jgi:hypothetical protein
VFEDVRFGDKVVDRRGTGRLSRIHTSGTCIQHRTFDDVVVAPQPIPESGAQVAARTSRRSQPDASAENRRTIRLETNLLPNPGFADGLRDWIKPPVERAAVKTRMTAEGQIAIVTDRSDSSVGIRCDVTELLGKSGRGEYCFGVVAMTSV